jgi:DNA-directed RNA polymerase subunit M/transcription elongation factor TFIIS
MDATDHSPADPSPASRPAARQSEAKPGEVDLAILRDGMRSLLTAALEKTVAAQEPACAPFVPAAGGLTAAAQELERAIYSTAARGARASGRLPHRRLYADTARAVNKALQTQVGPFPDDVVGLQYLAGRRRAEEVVADSRQTSDDPDPREVIRRLFVRTLMRAAAAYAQDRERALETARAIEVSCYNAAVRASKASEEPPRRQWDSPAFVDIYSTRCGTITILLDPSSSACRAYPAAPLVERLLAGTEPSREAPGESVPSARADTTQGTASDSDPAPPLPLPLRPEDLGDMTEKELCPQATAAERAEIAKRSEQKVAEKESNLFRCPHCGARRCTYREVQRRSLDEAPDYLCYCLSCNRRFTGRS